ncbi:MAG TPA: hypothetical protein VEF53_18650 [Patescibacteria group bacterium]|nr:hypothetical protein [Patescibacteria group bacterium]
MKQLNFDIVQESNNVINDYIKKTQPLWKKPKKWYQKIDWAEAITNMLFATGVIMFMVLLAQSIIK